MLHNINFCLATALSALLAATALMANKDIETRAH